MRFWPRRPNVGDHTTWQVDYPDKEPSKPITFGPKDTLRLTLNLTIDGWVLGHDAGKEEFRMLAHQKLDRLFDRLLLVEDQS